jgi:polysaccharide deacetylase 2 family uncharacterized protein YibQ
VNSSLFAGLAVGAGLVVTGIIGANVLFPPPRDIPAQLNGMAQTAPEREDAVAPTPLAPPNDDQPPAVEAPLPDEGALDGPVSEPAPHSAARDAPFMQAPRADAPPLAFADAVPEDAAPELLAPQDPTILELLPSWGAVTPHADSVLEGGPLQPPPPLGQIDHAPDAGTGPEIQFAPEPQVAQEDEQALPGIRMSGLPGIGARPDTPVLVDLGPLPDMTLRPAVLRNSLYQSATETGKKMAIVLSDPGLPMPIRRDLAALDFPFAVALDPLDSTATQAADLFFAAGKEVLILASGLPAGATASDLDVTLTAYFSALPQAVGVIDLPEHGFARNAGLLRDVLPLLAQDGHGLLTFSGGLTQAERAAGAAGIAHAEVFRVLDASDESIFTIRRYLDRAVFQASQIGHVIVFGDASQTETLEALQIWQEERRAGQVALVPVSGILLQNK